MGWRAGVSSWPYLESIGEISDLTLDPPPLEREKYGKTHVVGWGEERGSHLQPLGGKQDLTLDPPLLEATDVW